MQILMMNVMSWQSVSAGSLYPHCTLVRGRCLFVDLEGIKSNKIKVTENYSIIKCYECSFIIEFIKLAGKMVRCEALPSNLSFFSNEFNKFNNK